MKIYLLRHAERGHGKEQDTLTEKGILQSDELKERLKGYKIDKIFCSVSNRTKMTIKPFLEKFYGEVVYTPELEEMRLGILQGKTGQEFRDALAKSGLSKEDFRPEGGENKEDFEKRIKNFIRILKKEVAENILICTHAGVIRLFLKYLSKIDENNLPKPDFVSIIPIEIKF